MTNKTILVHYVPVGGYTAQKAKERLAQYAHMIETDDDEILNYIMPTLDGKTQIECLNPKMVTPDDYQILADKVHKLSETLENFMNKTTL